LDDKKQTQTKPISFSPQIFWGLKKQSQFSKIKMVINIDKTRDYVKFAVFKQQKNKAKQSQFFIFLSQKEPDMHYIARTVIL